MFDFFEALLIGITTILLIITTGWIISQISLWILAIPVGIMLSWFIGIVIRGMFFDK